MALQPGSLTASGGHGLRTPCKGLPRNQRPRLQRDPPLHAPVAASPRSPPGSALPHRRQLFAGQRPILTPGSPGHTAGLHELTRPGGKGAASDHQGPESRGNAARERPTRASLPPRAAVHMGTREVAGPRVPPSFAWSLICSPGLQEAVKRSLRALRSHMCRGTLCPTAHGPPHGLRPWQDHAVAASGIGRGRCGGDMEAFGVWGPPTPDTLPAALRCPRRGHRGTVRARGGTAQQWEQLPKTAGSRQHRGFYSEFCISGQVRTTAQNSHTLAPVSPVLTADRRILTAMIVDIALWAGFPSIYPTSLPPGGPIRPWAQELGLWPVKKN